MRYRAYMDDLKPAVPFLFIYDVAGGQNFDVTGAFHTWDTTKIITPAFIYCDDTNKITMGTNSSGFVKVTFECSFIGQNGAGILSASIYKNGVEVEGSSSEISFTAGETIYISNIFTIYLEKNDYIQIFCSATANSATSVAETSRITVEFIPMKGWDNSSGGRCEYKGGVLR